MTWLLCSLALLGTAAIAGQCSTVDNERIFGRDLKAASTAFAGTPDDAEIAFAPAPGVRRVLTPRELSKYGTVEGTLCFERAGSLLAVDALQSAMKEAFGTRKIDIQIVDYLKSPVPHGDLEFPIVGLSRPSLNALLAPVIWRGRLRFDGHKSLSVWASVLLTEKQQWIEAVVPLSPGVAITADQIRTCTGSRFPALAQVVADAAIYIGRSSRRLIPAAQELSPAWFGDPLLIAKGEMVQAEVVSGSISIRFDANAENGGRLNDSILIVDPQLGRRMKGRVAAKGKVLIDALQNKRTAPVSAVGDADRRRANPE